MWTLKTNLRTEDHHAPGAVKIWLAVKENLRVQLSADEWNLWVRPMRMLKVMDQRHLLLALPPNNAIMAAAVRRKPMLAAELAQYGFTFGISKYPDEYDRIQLTEKFGWEFPGYWMLVHGINPKDP